MQEVVGSNPTRPTLFQTVYKLMPEQSTREFLKSIDETSDEDLLEKAKRYWSEVESGADEIIKPTVGLDHQGELLFSWDLGEYYFEVEFRKSGIEGFWEIGNINEDTDYGGVDFPDVSAAVEWTIEHFNNAP